MKKKILFTVIALAAINLSFAATGKGYKVLDEEIYSASGFNFHVEEVQPGAAADQKKKRLKWSSKNKCTKQKWANKSKHYS